MPSALLNKRKRCVKIFEALRQYLYKRNKEKRCHSKSWCPSELKGAKAIASVVFSWVPGTHGIYKVQALTESDRFRPIVALQVFERLLRLLQKYSPILMKSPGIWIEKLIA